VHTARFLDLREGDVLCTTLPLFHTNALNTFFQALLMGATQVVEPRFSASGFWPAMVRTRAPSHTCWAPWCRSCWRSRPPTAERKHHVRVALAPGVPAELRPEFKRRTGIDLIDGYGSTETNFVIGDRISDQRPGKMGRLAQGFAARVVDAQDNALPPGAAGELVLRADEPFAFATGYFGMPDKTVKAWRNLWFHTGDRVVMDADGYFSFVDRLKDAIRRRGEKHFLLRGRAGAGGQCGRCRRCRLSGAVGLGRGRSDGGHHPQARPGDRPGRAAAYCEPRLPHYALPRYLDFVETLPTTENGKVRKTELRSQGVTPPPGTARNPATRSRAARVSASLTQVETFAGGLSTLALSLSKGEWCPTNAVLRQAQHWVGLAESSRASANCRTGLQMD
jgi:crotonobetaine/carnitine-CoA ligase